MGCTELVSNKRVPIPLDVDFVGVLTENSLSAGGEGSPLLLAIPFEREGWLLTLPNVSKSDVFNMCGTVTERTCLPFKMYVTFGKLGPGVGVSKGKEISQTINLVANQAGILFLSLANFIYKYKHMVTKPPYILLGGNM